MDNTDSDIKDWLIVYIIIKNVYEKYIYTIIYSYIFIHMNG